MMTVQEIIAAQIDSTFDFDVQKFPLAGPDGMRTPHYGLFRDDTGECVGNAVRRGYMPHTVDDIKALAEAAAAAFDRAASVEVKARWSDGHYLSVKPTDEYRREIFGGDSIFPAMLISAGFDGRAFRAELGVYRDLCANLSTMQPVDGRRVKTKVSHTSKLRRVMPELIEQFAYVARGWDSVIDTAEQLAESKVVLADYLAAVYPERPKTKTAETRATKRIEAIIRRVSREQRQLGLNAGLTEVSAWLAFNAVQGYVQYDTNRRGRVSATDRAWMALDDKTVSRAYAVAVSA